MKKKAKSTLALAFMAITSLPVMAESVDVRVTGTITPTACTPTLSGGGTIDYGAINPTTLSATSFNVLPEKTLDFIIACDAPAKIAIKGINQRKGSVAGATENGNSTAPSPVQIFSRDKVGVVGLGKDGTKNIGGYGLRILPSSVLADSQSVDSLAKAFSQAGWVNIPSSGDVFDNTYTRMTSWSLPGTLDPLAFKTLSGKLSVQAYINKASELDMTKPIALDGLTTIELIYL